MTQSINTLTGTQNIDEFDFPIGNFTDTIIENATAEDKITFNKVNLAGGYNAGSFFVSIKEAQTFDNLNFTKADDNLVISKKDNTKGTITIDNYFTSSNKLDSVVSVNPKFIGVDENGNGRVKYSTDDNGQIIFENYHITNSIKNDAQIFIPRSENSTSYKGNEYNEIINSNKGNETFNMGLGSNTINFQGSFGDDKIELTSGETLNLNIKTIGGNDATDIVYELSSNKKDLIISSNVEYYATADISALNGKTATVDGIEVPTGEWRFELGQYGLPGIAELEGNYMWRSQYAYEELENKPIYVYLDNSDFSATSPIEFSGIKISNITVHKISNGKEVQGFDADYKTAIANLTSVSDYCYNENIYNSQISGSITILNYQIKDNHDIIKINGTNIYEVDDFRKMVTHSVEDFKNGKFNGSVMADIINAQNYDSPNGKKGVIINSGAGDDSITGSYFNDTIKSSSGDNTIEEMAGTNKITLGKGNDTIFLDYYSSNTLNAGSGANTFFISNSGTNKITAGAGNDNANILSGYNNIKLGNGLNEVTIGDNTGAFSSNTSINTITTGKHTDIFNIYSGKNNIKSGSGNDVFTILGGSNTINSGNGYSIISIDDGINSITSGKNSDTYTVSGGLNVINSGKGNDTFTVTGGVNNLKGGSGTDTFIVSDGGIMQAAASTLNVTRLNGGSGNDIYDIDKSAYNNSLVNIVDTSGKNSLILDDKLDVYFNVKLGKRGKFSIDKNIIFTNGFDSDSDGKLDANSLNTGISVTGKNYKSITNVTVDGIEADTKFTFNVKELAADVAGWLAENGYKSAASVLGSGKADDINALLGVYAGTGDYIGSAQCYKNPIIQA